MPSWLTAALRILIIVLMPIVLVLLNVRILLTPLYINWEYNLAGFPADLYGFTKDDRLTYSRIALDYLLNEAGIEFLGDLKFPTGVVAPPESQPYYLAPRDPSYLYNDRELKHMLDVKIVVKNAMAVWIGSSVIWLVAIALLAWKPETHPLLRSGLAVGALTTIGVLIGLGIFIAIGFNTFFVLFHRVFFEGDTWLFLWSDTLIRLFPLKFWNDVFLWLAGGTLAEAAFLGAAAWFGIKAK